MSEATSARPLPHPPGDPALRRRLLDDRERFLAFAFAGADLLIEATADGRVAFAAGAFRARLGREPATYVGGPAEAVVAPEDRAAFAACIGLLGSSGRLAPVAMRLADTARTVYRLPAP